MLAAMLTRLRDFNIGGWAAHPVPARGADALVLFGALWLYWSTLAPGVLPADAGEFQLAAARLGIAHPPGYPLYTLTGALFALLMPWNPMRGINLFSAVTMALAVMLAGRAARRFSGSVWGGVAAAVMLAVAASVWSTATQASIRPLTAFFTALCLERLAAYRNTRHDRALIGFALGLGAGLAHHPSLAFPGLFFGIYLLLIDPALIRQPRRWWAPLGAFALGFLPWLYLPIRGSMAGAPFAPEGIDTWRGFWDHVLARGFAGDFFYYRTPTELADRARIWLNVMALEWNPAILVATGIAALRLGWRDWRTALLLGGAFVLHSAITMTYRAPQTVEYLIPAYVALAVVLGAAIYVTPRPTRIAAGELFPYYGILSLIIFLLGVVASGAHLVRQWPSFAWLAQDDSTRATAEGLFDAAPPEAVILASWHWATPMQALQAIEGTRPDVEVVYVYPEGAEPLADTWVRRIGDAIGDRPVVVTSYYLDAFNAAGYFFEPVDGGWRVGEQPRRDLPEGMIAVEWKLDNGLTLAGYEIVSEPRVGETFEVRAAWRIDAPLSQDVAASVSLNNASLAIHNRDVWMPTSRAQVGDVLVTRHILGMPPYGLPSPQDQYWLLASAYTLEPDGTPQNIPSAGRFLFTTLTEITVAPAVWPNPGGEGAISLGGEMLLTEIKVTPEGLLNPGDEVIVDLTFRGARPLLRDYVVKVDLIGEGYAWRAQSDHIPATGALPTLKWLWAWEVHDRHRLIVPPDADVSAAHAELVVYDHFTGEVLPILDVELARQGIAIPLYTWEP